MGVQTGADLLAPVGWRKRLVQARLAALITSSVRLGGRRSTLVRELRLDEGDICNPSITRHDGGLIVAVRRPSYRLVGTRLRLAPGSTLESTTELFSIDEDLNTVRTTAVETLPVTERFAVARDGLEDPRLFTVADRLYCLWSGLSLGSKAPTRDHAGMDWEADWSETTNTMVVAEVRGRHVVGAQVIGSPMGRPREKNWMPLDDDDDVGFIYYLADGTFVRTSTPDEGGVDVHRVAVPPAVQRTLRGWSGSSQAIHWGGGRLCVVHLALRGIPILSRIRPAVYLHRFVELDRSGAIVAVSRPFRFLGLGVEFCAGAVLDGERVVLSFGVDDSRAFVCRLPTARVRSMLKRVR